MVFVVYNFAFPNIRTTLPHGATQIDISFPCAGRKNLPQSRYDEQGRQARLDRGVCLFGVRPALPPRSKRSGYAYP